MTEAPAKDPESAVLSEGSCCLVCYEDLDLENAVSYQAKADGPWDISKFCLDCIKRLIETQYMRYINSVRNSTCAREQRALLDRGPPVNVSDRLGFPMAEENEVHMLYDCGAKKYLSPRLHGTPETPEERQRVWDELLMFRIKGDAEE